MASANDSLLVFLVVLVSTVGMAQQQSPQARPSLADTEKWILNTFDENSGSSSGSLSCSESIPESIAKTLANPDSDANLEYRTDFWCRYEKYGLYFDGCKVTLVTIRSHRVLMNGHVDKGDDNKDNTGAVFDLGDIDPTSIKAEKPHGEFGPLDKKTYHYSKPLVDVCLSTTDSADTITLVYTESKNRYKIHELCGPIEPFVTVDLEYAPRFVKAFRHAVELCGGKPSAF